MQLCALIFTYLQPFLLLTDHQKWCPVNLLASYGAAVGTDVYSSKLQHLIQEMSFR